MTAGTAGLGRLERYLAGIPGGLDAFPQAKAKGVLVRNLLEDQPVPELLPALPPPLRRLAADPPVGSEWIPEVQFAALLHAVAGVRGMSDAELLAWIRARNRVLFGGPAYRILMAVASPAVLLRFAGQRWANWHRGTRLELEGVSDDGVRLSLRFPVGLFDAVLVRVFAEAFAAALELSHARDPVVRVEAEDAGSARYLARW